MTQRGLFGGGSVRRLPLTVDECPLETAERPCPFVSCRHHLLIDQDTRWVGNRATDGLTINPVAIAAAGSDIDNWTEDDVETALLSLKESCALDVATEGPRDQTEVAELMGLGRTLVEKIEHASINRLRLSQGGPQTAMGSGSVDPRGRAKASGLAGASRRLAGQGGACAGHLPGLDLEGAASEPDRSEVEGEG